MSGEPGARPDSAEPPRHDPYAAIREPNYRWFISGWMPASIGLQMQGMALGWEVYERTGDPLALGSIGLARVLPVVLLALPAGQIVDMLDRRRVLLFTQIAFACASVLLTLASVAWSKNMLGEPHQAVWIMYAIVMLTGCARVFNGPSRASLLPTIVRGGADGEAFHNAVTWNSGVFQFAATTGPLIAGGLIWLTGAAWPVYAITSLSCLWFAFACQFIRPIDEAHQVHKASGVRIWEAVRPSVLIPGMLEGVRHVWREKAVLGAISLDMFAVLLGGATALMPIFAKDILHVGPVGLGALRAAPYVGALIMAFVLAHRRPFEKSGQALLWSVAAFGICTIVFGFSTSFWLSIAMLLILGAVDNISVVIRHVLVSVRTPDRLRGRVSAVNTVFIESSNELGGFESGLVAKLFTPVISVVSGGIGTIIVVAIMALALPDLRRLGRLQAKSTGPQGRTCTACEHNLSDIESDACPSCGQPIPSEVRNLASTPTPAAK